MDSSRHFRTRYLLFELLIEVAEATETVGKTEENSTISASHSFFWNIIRNLGVLTMYKPNFCSECGAKLLRLHWHFWTSRRFCSDCARRLRKTRLLPTLFATLGLLGAGYVAGRVRRPPAPPLTIERRADSPLTDNDVVGRSNARPPAPGSSANENTNNSPMVEEIVYLCGARTKKGTPCSRRVHGPVRCWQHKGMPSIIPIVPIK